MCVCVNKYICVVYTQKNVLTRYFRVLDFVCFFRRLRGRAHVKFSRRHAMNFGNRENGTTRYYEVTRPPPFANNWKLDLNGIYDCCLPGQPISSQAARLVYILIKHLIYEPESYFYYFCPVAVARRLPRQKNKPNYVDAFFRTRRKKYTHTLFCFRAIPEVFFFFMYFRVYVLYIFFFPLPSAVVR